MATKTYLVRLAGEADSIKIRATKVSCKCDGTLEFYRGDQHVGHVEGAVKAWWIPNMTDLKGLSVDDMRTLRDIMAKLNYKNEVTDLADEVLVG